MSKYVFIALFVIGLIITLSPIKTYEAYGSETPVYCENGKDTYNSRIGYSGSCEEGEVIGIIASDGIKEYPERLALKAVGYLLVIFTPIAYVVFNVIKRHRAKARARM